MAFENFKETIWAAGIERALKKRLGLASRCNTQYQGDVGQGKRVKIVGAMRPTINTYIPGKSINVAESPLDTGVYLDVDQYKYANFFVDSVDAAQTDKDIMAALSEGAADGIAEMRDMYVGGLAAQSENMSDSALVDTPAKALREIDNALVGLWEMGVRTTDDIMIECPPWFYDMITNHIIADSTNNTNLIATGELGRYKGAHIHMSNCLYNDGTDDFIMVRTKKAIAFAGGIHRVIPYEPELQFGEAVKVLDTYGAKIVRPVELFVVKAHGAE